MDRVNSNAKESVKKSRHLTDAVTQREASEYQCMKGKSESEVVQSCLTLSDPMDCSLPGSSIHPFHPTRL